MVRLGVAGRQLQPERDDAELLLAGEPLGSQLVPAAVVATVVLLDVRGGRVQRGVDRAVREVEEERLLGVARLALADHRDRVVGEIVGEVVVVGVAVDLDEVVVLHDAVRVVLVGERVEDPVEPLEAALARPRVLGAGRRAVGVLREVPLPDHHRGVARLVPEDLRDRRRVGAELHRVAREPRVEVGDRAEPGPVGLEPGEQRGPGRRAQRRGVEVRGADPARRERVEVWGVDLRAVATEVGEPEVVGEHHDDVRRARGRGRARRPRSL